MSQQTIHIPLGYSATVTSDVFSSGTYVRTEPGGTRYTPDEISADSTVVIGPFNEPRDYILYGDGNEYDCVIAQSGVFTGSDEISGVTIPTVTVAGDDSVLIQDTSDSNVLKVVTAQDIADLVIDSTVAATKQDLIDGATLTGVSVATNDKVLIQDTSDSDNLKTVTTQAIADLFDASGYVPIPGSPSTLSTLANNATGTQIATAVNAINTILIAAGLAVGP